MFSSKHIFATLVLVFLLSFHKSAILLCCRYWVNIITDEKNQNWLDSINRKTPYHIIWLPIKLVRTVKTVKNFNYTKHFIDAAFFWCFPSRYYHRGLVFIIGSLESLATRVGFLGVSFSIFPALEDLWKSSIMNNTQVCRICAKKNNHLLRFYFLLQI